MLAYNFIKNWIDDIWCFGEKDVVEYVINIIKTVFGVIPTLFITMLDLILSPIEIIAVIMWKLRGDKQ